MSNATQSQQNLVRLAVLVRKNKEQFAAVCATAKKLKLQGLKRKVPTQNVSSVRLQNFVRGIPHADLKNAIGKYGVTSIHTVVNCASIQGAFTRKQAERAACKRGN